MLTLPTEDELAAFVKENWLPLMLPLMTEGVSRQRFHDKWTEHAKKSERFTMDLIVAAENGNRLAHEVLRDLGTEVVGRERLPAALANYVQKCLQNDGPPQAFRAGNSAADDYMRNHGLCVAMRLLCDMFEPHLHPTRNREARRANRYPCAASVMAKALEGSEYPLAEVRATNIWLDYSSGRFLTRLSALLPPQQ